MKLVLSRAITRCCWKTMLSLLWVLLTVPHAAATVISLDWQLSPVANRLPAAAAEVSFAVKDQALIVQIDVQDSQVDSLRSVRRAPDGIREMDTYLVLYVDGAGVGKFARVFVISPLGGIADGTYQEGGNPDYGADFRWTATAKVNASGWNAQLAIPLGQLGLTPQGNPKVYLQYHRSGSQMEVFANADPKAKGDCLLCVASALPELQGESSQGAAWQLQTSAYAISGSTQSGGSKQHYQQIKASVTGVWQASELLTLRGTLNPNFAEREPDFPVLRFGTQFSAALQESRQFFAQGADLLETPGLMLINTRSIASPSAAGAAEYRSENLRATAVLANDQAGGLVLLPGSYGNRVVQAPASRSLVLRGVAALAQGDMGVAVMERNFTGAGSSQLMGVDATHRFGDGYSVTGLLANSRSTACGATGALLPCNALSGNALYARLGQNRSKDGFAIRFTDIGPDFRADLGAVSQAGVRKLNASWWRDLERPLEAIPKLHIRPSVKLANDYDGRAIERTAQVYLEGSWRDALNAWVTVTPASQLRLQREGDLVDARQIDLSASISPNTTWTKLGGQLILGELPDYSNARAGKGLSGGMEALFALPQGVSLQAVFFGYRTRGLSAVDYSGPSYQDLAAIVIANWQYAAFSRVRYVFNRSRSQGIDLTSQTAYQSQSAAHSWLWEHAPRVGWAWSLGLTTVSAPGGTARSRELLAKLSHAF